MRIRCKRCGESVSTEVPDDTVVWAWVECPECLEAEKSKKPKKPKKKPKTFSLPRAALHFPVGCFVAWLTMSVDAPLGVLLGVSFLIYELAEDWRIRDRGFLDIAGFAFGLGAGGAAIWLVRWLT